MSSEVEVTCVVERAAVEALEVEWDALLEQTDVSSPFLTPGWQRAWLETYGVARRPYVLVARRAGHLVGLWPLAVRKRGLFRILEPIGTGRSDWLDVPVLPGERKTVLAAFLRYLEAHRSAWDLLEMRDVLADSPLLPALRATLETLSLQFRRAPRTVAPYLELAGTWEQFLASKRPKFRSNLKYYRRLAERDGQKLTTGRVPWGADALETLAVIEGASWKARDGNLKVEYSAGEGVLREVLPIFLGARSPGTVAGGSGWQAARLRAQYRLRREGLPLQHVL